MALPARKKATYDDVLAAPDHVIAEIIDGELLMSPRPACPHVLANAGIVAILYAHFHGRGPTRSGPGGWWIVDEPELHFGEEIVVPDVAGWRRERLPTWPETAFLTLPPDWVCEIVSPSSSRTDRVSKMAIWAREGVGHYWIVDPAARSLEVYRLTSGLMAWVQGFGDDEVVRAEPFDAVEIEMAGWWG